MKQLLDSDIELLVESDFIYLPLLFDPEIEKEVQIISQRKESTSPALKTIIRHNGRYFIKGLEISSVLENFKKIHAYGYQRIKNECLNTYGLLNGIDNILSDRTLHIILFQVMPYFIRKNRALSSKKPDRMEILELVLEKLDISESYFEKAKTFLNVAPLRDIIDNLHVQNALFEPLENGLIAMPQLRNWLNGVIQASVLEDQRNRITEALKVRQQFSQMKPKHIAVMLYIADVGKLEIDGFGFSKSDSYREYLVYKRTGEYTLKDYYARSYYFPDCRVAISTYAPFWPFVIEKYKHPFLLRHKAGQEICMKNFRPPDKLTAENIIKVLEEGLTAMRYGYDGRRRNGYHSLDKTWVHIPTIDFEDYRI